MKYDEKLVRAFCERAHAHVQIWDVHPMIPLIKNAGGLINTWKNKDAKQAGNIVASSNIKTHKKLLKMLKPVA